MAIGVITGTGTYVLPGFQDARAEAVKTRFGRVEASVGRVDRTDVVHISRHGPGHPRLSNHVNHRANVLALRELGATAVVAVTVCGAVDPEVPLGSLVVFDDLHFTVNRLPRGELCTLYDEPGAAERGHWIFERPFSEPLRAALLAAAGESGHPARDRGCYGHVDGPRFNTRAEIRGLALCGVTAVSQTAGPETVLCGEAELPFALLGYATDYANGVKEEPTPVADLLALIERSTETFSAVLSAALPAVAAAGAGPVGTVYRFE